MRLLVAEHERSLTDPHIIINVMRSIDEFYEGMAALKGGGGTGLSVGSIDSGSTKSFDFFGTATIVDEISALLISVWDRIKYSAEENFRYQVEVAMMAAGFIGRVKDAQTGGLISEEQGQRITRSVAKAIETLFRSGAYTEEMDSVREVRASSFLVPKTQLLEYRREDARVEFKTIEMRDGMETADKGEPLARVERPFLRPLLAIYDHAPGRVKAKHEPPPGRSLTPIVPPCASTSRLQMASPRPRPPAWLSSPACT